MLCVDNYGTAWDYVYHETDLENAQAKQGCSGYGRSGNGAAATRSAVTFGHGFLADIAFAIVVGILAVRSGLAAVATDMLVVIRCMNAYLATANITNMVFILIKIRAVGRP